jgi:integrase
VRDVQNYARIKRAFGSKPVDQITRQEIQVFQTDLLAEGLAPATCNLHIRLLGHVLNLAVDWEMLSKNPAARIPLFTLDNKVENYMDDKELGQLLYVLRTDKNRPACNVALFLLSTGARLNEALKATWSQVDRENRVWRIPAANSKSKKVRAVPLNDSALEVLNQLGSEGRSEYLFINPKTKKPLTSIQHGWDRLRWMAGLPHLRIHDLRHQYASFLVNSGRTLYEVQQILGHSDPLVTQRYAHLSTRTLQDAADSASDTIKRVTKAA